MSEWDIRQNYATTGYVVQNRTRVEHLTERHYCSTFWGAKRKVRKLERRDRKRLAQEQKIRDWNER